MLATSCWQCWLRISATWVVTCLGMCIIVLGDISPKDASIVGSVVTIPPRKYCSLKKQEADFFFYVCHFASLQPAKLCCRLVTTALLVPPLVALPIPLWLLLQPSAAHCCCYSTAAATTALILTPLLTALLLLSHITMGSYFQVWVVDLVLFN